MKNLFSFRLYHVIDFAIMDVTKLKKVKRWKQILSRSAPGMSAG